MKTKILILKLIPQLQTKLFEVRKDTKPTFELCLTTPGKSVAYRDGSIKIKVKVKVLVKSSIIGSSGFTGSLETICWHKRVAIFKKILRIEDSTVIELDFKNDLQLTEISESTRFDLLIKFTEDESNETYSASTSFSVEMSDYSIHIVHSPQFFKPGLPYSFTILVTRMNGYPVLNSEFSVTIQVK